LLSVIFWSKVITLSNAYTVLQIEMKRRILMCYYYYKSKTGIFSKKISKMMSHHHCCFFSQSTYNRPVVARGLGAAREPRCWGPFAASASAATGTESWSWRRSRTPRRSPAGEGRARCATFPADECWACRQRVLKFK